MCGERRARRLQLLSCARRGGDRPQHERCGSHGEQANQFRRLQPDWRQLLLAISDDDDEAAAENCSFSFRIVSVRSAFSTSVVAFQSCRTTRVSTVSNARAYSPEFASTR